MGVKVCKFGGTSLANADQIRKAQQIIESDPERRYVVPSAPGKRSKDDQKITDLLYLCREHATANRIIASRTLVPINALAIGPAVLYAAAERTQLYTPESTSKAMAIHCTLAHRLLTTLCSFSWAVSSSCLAAGRRQKAINVSPPTATMALTM